MFELRLQDAQAARAGTVEGLPLGRFLTYDDAISALDTARDQLAAQLAQNGEGWSTLHLDMTIVEVDGGAEAGWLWSSFRPGTDPTSR